MLLWKQQSLSDRARQGDTEALDELLRCSEDGDPDAKALVNELILRGLRADEAARQPSSASVELDFDRLAGAGIITPSSPDGLLAEQFRMIKRPLLIKAAADQLDQARRANLILITSSIPGEGKTFTSINLAMSIAMELDRTVLLVDGDVHRSDVTGLVDVDRRNIQGQSITVLLDQSHRRFGARSDV